MLRVSLFVIGFLALAGGAYWYFFVPQVPSEEPQPVQKHIIRRSAHGSGQIEGNGVAVKMRCPFGGLVDEVNFKEGDSVKQGDIVAKINTTELDGKIKLEELTLKENKAKREALSSRKSAELVEKARDDLRTAEAFVSELKALKARLLTERGQIERQEESERARRNFERAEAALAEAEAEYKRLKAHPTPDELAVATAALDLAKLRNEEAKRKGQDVDIAKAELTLRLAEYDKAKRGAAPEDLAAAAAGVAHARSNRDAADAEKKRLDGNPLPKPIPEAELKAIDKSIADAEAREKAKREELEKLRGEADQAEVRAADAAVERSDELLKILKRNREGYDLHAPFDALVTRRLVEPGALLQPFEEVLWLIDFTKKRVRAEFDVVTLPSLMKADLKASIKSRAFGKDELSARVIAVRNVRTRNLLLDDPSAPKGGEVVEVLLEIVPPEDPAKKELFALLRPGLRVETDIVLELRADALSVPKSYVASETDDEGKERQFVWKVDTDSKRGRFLNPRKQPVTCGLRDEYFVEITEGLHVDDLVIKPKPQGK